MTFGIPTSKSFHMGVPSASVHKLGVPSAGNHGGGKVPVQPVKPKKITQPVQSNPISKLVANFKRVLK
jgi:hypothetical protein